MDTVDGAMGAVNGVISSVFFYDVAFWSDTITIPFVVIWLVVASTFLTVRMGFINVRAFKHALQVTAGKFTDPNAPVMSRTFRRSPRRSPPPSASATSPAWPSPCPPAVRARRSG
jgi:hypothetical protein